MATATKNARTLLESTALAAGGAATGAGLALATALGALATLVVTNGAAAPTAGGEAIVEISPDGLAWHEFSRQRAGVEPATAYALHVEIPPSVLYARARFAGDPAAALTVSAHLHELSSLG